MAPTAKPGQLPSSTRNWGSCEHLAAGLWGPRAIQVRPEMTTGRQGMGRPMHRLITALTTALLLGCGARTQGDRDPDEASAMSGETGGT